MTTPTPEATPELLTAEAVLAFEPSANPAQVAVLVEETVARAKLRVPILESGTLTATQITAVRGVLRTAVVRFLREGDSSVTTESAPGGYSRTIQVSGRRSPLSDADVTELYEIFGLSERKSTGAAFSLEQTEFDPGHEDGCAYYWHLPCDCDRTYSGSAVHIWWR